MANYAFRTLEKRKELQMLYEQGLRAETLASLLDVSINTIFTELRRGTVEGEYLPNGKPKYDPVLAQEVMQQSFAKRANYLVQLNKARSHASGRGYEEEIT